MLVSNTFRRKWVYGDRRSDTAALVRDLRLWRSCGGGCGDHVPAAVAGAARRRTQNACSSLA